MHMNTYAHTQAYMYLLYIHIPFHTVPPTVSATFSYLTIIEGDNKTLNFTVTGDPPPHSYTWLRNGQLLIDDERVSTANNVLRIRKASRLDSGNYTLRVASSVGEDTAWTVLEVACEQVKYLVFCGRICANPTTRAFLQNFNFQDVISQQSLARHD